MSNVIVAWSPVMGDEGKGKVVGLLAERFDVVARYQGGHNAGHTVSVGPEICIEADPSAEFCALV